MSDAVLKFASEDDSDLYFALMVQLAQNYEAELLRTSNETEAETDIAHFHQYMALAEEKQQKRNRRKEWKKAIHFTEKVAVFLVAFILAGSFAVVQVDAFREPFANWLMNWKEKGVSIFFDQESEIDVSDLSYSFGWLPEGTYLVKVDFPYPSFEIYREDKNVGHIDIIPFTFNVGMGHDTEDVYMERLQVEGYLDAIYFEKTYQTGDIARDVIATNEYCVVDVISYTDPENVLSRESVEKILRNIKLHA